MSNDKSVLTILTDTLVTVAERALVAEHEQSAVKEERDQWFRFYIAQKKLEEDLQATYKRLKEAEDHAAQMEDERNAARLVAERKRAELETLKGAKSHE